MGKFNFNRYALNKKLTDIELGYFKKIHLQCYRSSYLPTFHTIWSLNLSEVVHIQWNSDCLFIKHSWFHRYPELIAEIHSDAHLKEKRRVEYWILSVSQDFVETVHFMDGGWNRSDLNKTTTFGKHLANFLTLGWYMDLSSERLCDP